jgi:hypothetical protein
MSCLLAWLYVPIARRWLTSPSNNNSSSSSSVNYQACSDTIAMPISSLLEHQPQLQQQQQQTWTTQPVTVFDAQYCGALRQALDMRYPREQLMGSWLDVLQQLQSVSECAYARAESSSLQRHDGKALCFRLRDEQLLEHAHSVLSLFVATAALPPVAKDNNLAGEYR